MGNARLTAQLTNATQPLKVRRVNYACFELSQENIAGDSYTPKQEAKDRKANKETVLDAILGHEIGHAYSISRNWNAHKKRSDDDKKNGVVYKSRQNEIYADNYLKTISAERAASSGLRSFQTKYRF